MVLDRPLASSGDDQDVGDAGRDGLLDDVLDRRLVDDRKHLLGLALRRGKEPRSEPCGRDHRLSHRLLAHELLLVAVDRAASWAWTRGPPLRPAKRYLPRCIGASGDRVDGLSVGGAAATALSVGFGCQPATERVLLPAYETAEVRGVAQDDHDRQRGRHRDVEPAAAPP